MALPPESRRETLDKAMLEMVGQKKRLEAERAFLSDQLTQVICRVVQRMLLLLLLLLSSHENHPGLCIYPVPPTTSYLDVRYARTAWHGL